MRSCRRRPIATTSTRPSTSPTIRIVVNSFKTKFENAWVDTTNYTNYANAPNSSLVRRYPIYPIDPELNLAPASGTASYRSRSVAAYNAETQRIDVIMYRITDQAHVDALINRFRAGVPVRFYTEQAMYRDLTQPWHSYSVDRLYAAGIPIKDRAHAGQNHEKLVLLYGQRMSIFGSSNMTSKSSDSQHEHNYFTTKPEIFTWFASQFERKWNNTNPVGAPETKAVRAAAARCAGLLNRLATAHRRRQPLASS